MIDFVTVYYYLKHVIWSYFVDQELISLMEEAIFNYHKDGVIPEELLEQIEFMMWARHNNKGH